MARTAPASTGGGVQSLVQEDSTCCRATEPTRHSYRACTLSPGARGTEPTRHSYWARALSPRAGRTEPTCHSYWASALSPRAGRTEPTGHSDWSPGTPGPVLHSERNPCGRKKPRAAVKRAPPALRNQRMPERGNEDPAHLKKLLSFSESQTIFKLTNFSLVTYFTSETYPKEIPWNAEKYSTVAYFKTAKGLEITKTRHHSAVIEHSLMHFMG